MYSKERLPWLVVVLLVGALISTVGWALSARRQAPDSQATAAAAVPAAHAGHDAAAHGSGGAAQDTPAIAPRDGVLAMTVPPLPKTAINFTFKAAKVAKNLPVDATTTIQLTAPAKPGLYDFYCKYHLQMMEGAVTVR
jgi:plastocyanin